VKLTLSSQETVKDFYTILGSVILQARIFQTKKTRALYHACGLRYFDKKIHTLKKKQDILCAPTVFCSARLQHVSINSGFYRAN
jgi:hypothetical protein